jgi:hypothetical protein
VTPGIDQPLRDAIVPAVWAPFYAETSIPAAVRVGETLRLNGVGQSRGAGKPAVGSRVVDEDATVMLREVEIPTLVLIGRKDLQIDATLDGKLLERAALGMGNIKFSYPANANHVFKEDNRSLVEIVAAPGTGYNETGTHLDAEALETIFGWLQDVFA